MTFQISKRLFLPKTLVKYGFMITIRNFNLFVKKNTLIKVKLNIFNKKLFIRGEL